MAGAVFDAEAGKRQCLVQEQGSETVFGVGAVYRSVFGAGGREGAEAVIVAEAVAGADESMIPPKYDPADELSLSYDTPAPTLSHSRRLIALMSTWSY
jgi:hypothetical protein